MGEPAAVMYKVLEGKYAPIERRDYAREVKELVYQMMNKDAARRPSVASLISHALLNGPSVALPPPVSLPSVPVLFERATNHPFDHPFDLASSAHVGTPVHTPAPTANSPPAFFYPAPLPPPINITPEVTVLINEMAVGNPTGELKDFRGEFENLMGRMPSAGEAALYLRALKNAGMQHQMGGK